MYGRVKNLKQTCYVSQYEMRAHVVLSGKFGVQM